MTPEEFRAAAHTLVDWIADCRAKVYNGELPVLSANKPGDVRAALPATPPETPEPFDAVMRDLDSIILPGCTHWQSPSFFGYFLEQRARGGAR